jgi:hypothetical protein
MATNIGTGPQDIPLNQFLGEMAFMDNILEQGTYTSWISDGVNTHLGGIYGRYVKIGNWVVANINIRNPGANTINSGGGAGLPWRIGLPYHLENMGGEYIGGHVGYNRYIPTVTNGTWLSLYINANATYNYCNIVWSGPSLAETTPVLGGMSNSTLFTGQLIYQTNGEKSISTGPGNT